MSTTNAVTIIQQARSQNRLFLTEVEAKTFLSAANIPVAQTKLARTKDEAIAHAQKL